MPLSVELVVDVLDAKSEWGGALWEGRGNVRFRRTSDAEPKPRAARCDLISCFRPHPRQRRPRRRPHRRQRLRQE
jgi:hypothetical protein